MVRRARRTGSALIVLMMAGSLFALEAPGASAKPAARSDHRAGHQVLIPTNPNVPLPRRAGSADSLNWSGYADLPAAGQRVTSVTGNWIVPTAQLLPPGFSASWTGIGGYNSSDLIQAGTSADALPVTGSQYYAWYEILPAAETPITNCSGDAACTVHPGDAVTVSITSQGGSQWSISMADKGHWTWSTTLSYGSTFSSAEWILEAPTLVVQTIIANVGTATFDPGNTFALDGATKTIAQGNPISIRLSPGGPIAEAIPSVLDSDGDGFNGCTYALSCAPPSS
jgi:hypothetical protein